MQDLELLGPCRWWEEAGVFLHAMGRHWRLQGRKQYDLIDVPLRCSRRLCGG